MRKKFEKEHPEYTTQAWGFEFDKKEINRAERHRTNHPESNHVFPLIDEQINKERALGILLQAGIELPAMYKLGYHNSNCVGCPKGGMAYWNKIRVDFPELFNKMAKIERTIGRSCLKKYFLDELPLDAGRDQEPLVADCGSVGEGCEIELSRTYASRE